MTDFRHAALCRGMDPEVFWPTAEPTSPAYAEQVRPALAVCAECPVQAECRAAALWGELAADTWSVLGGLTAPERAMLRQRPLARLAAV